MRHANYADLATSLELKAPRKKKYSPDCDLDLFQYQAFFRTQVTIEKVHAYNTAEKNKQKSSKLSKKIYVLTGVKL